MGEIIQINNLTHTYTDHEGKLNHALSGVCLTVHKGEFIAVIGTNGSGKSTLAKHLNALLLPSGGQCLVNGLDVSDSANLWSVRQTVGMVFQNPDNQIVAAIVEEDVAFGPENLGIPSAEIVRRVDEALARVGMEEYRNHAPHLLSGGQKQRVAIAGVLAMRPECVVLDEPTAMLDPQGRREVLSTVHKLNKEEDITVVYITHFMEEAVTANRVIVMEQGKVIMEGPPDTIFIRVEQMKNMGLDVPVAAEVALRLREQGMHLSSSIITDEELAVALCP